ncbi:hypothetical protein RM704_23135 [Streptomyces sp. DSM 3412]|uniref:Uncharacterized protein n=1 Tax=Streptomyces gottesmaniae TaxID=3075518 RepID=A0ABU2Z163_9ACTN|nr:hypothetical protein [Streptomyces sp. DSM 3412]MDT0570327.1 hypothetical protein [Streptomyces sp. DSM 3412]
MTSADHGDSQAADGESPTTDLRRWKVGGLVALLLLLSNVPLVCLVILWPESAELTKPGRIHVLDWSWTLSPERRILLCVAFCGLLGCSIRMLLRIRGDFASPDDRSWDIPWCFLTPPIGAILALGFYLVIRGGFFAAPTAAESVNLFAFGGTGVLVGLFAESATERLEGAFSGAFSGAGRQSPEPSHRDESTDAPEHSSRT